MLSTQVGGPLGIGVLSISVSERELARMRVHEEALRICVVVLAVADGCTPESAKGRPLEALTDGMIVCESPVVVAAEEQATVSIDLPTYLLTFLPTYLLTYLLSYFLRRRCQSTSLMAQGTTW